MEGYKGLFMLLLNLCC